MDRHHKGIIRKPFKAIVYAVCDAARPPSSKSSSGPEGRGSKLKRTMEKENLPAFQRIVCAVDSMSDDASTTNAPLGAMVRNLRAKSPIEIDATFLLNPNSAGVIPLLFASGRADLLAQAEENLALFTSLLGSPIGVHREVLFVR